MGVSVGNPEHIESRLQRESLRNYEKFHESSSRSTCSVGDCGMAAAQVSNALKSPAAPMG